MEQVIEFLLKQGMAGVLIILLTFWGYSERRDRLTLAKHNRELHKRIEGILYNARANSKSS